MEAGSGSGSRPIESTEPIPSLVTSSALLTTHRPYPPVGVFWLRSQHAVPYFDGPVHLVSPQNHQLKHQDITSRTSRGILNKTPPILSKLQILAVLSGESLLTQSVPSSATQSIDPPSPASQSSIMWTNPGGHQKARKSPNVRNGQHGQSGMQSVTSSFNSGIQDHEVAYHPRGNAQISAYPLRNDTEFTMGSNPLTPPSDLHAGQTQRTPTRGMLEAQSVHLDATSAAIPDSLPKQAFLLQQQQNDSDQEHRDIQENVFLPFSHHAGKINSLVRRRRYPRPRGVEKKFYCSECPDYFWDRSNRDRHISNCHPKQKLDFHCEYCSASYGTKSARTVHTRRAHPEKTSHIPHGQVQARNVDGKCRFFCYYPKCDKNYTQPSNVYRHVEMEHLKKRYPCECGYEGTTRHNLKVHQATVHRI